MDDNDKRLVDSVLKRFFTLDGKLKHLPAQLKKKHCIGTPHCGSGEGEDLFRERIE
ncbi:hypothetical protein O9H85_24130 [Paenibacillus filicis]|uniref:Uncharacterized protein n=1 Tax=Paenibacillus gyeongsangnamensis TaxID=3388067 RepID=A0ABT4QEZ0_9BACL|nr:hypothetical protein [Paenibacillus filicis]MCZ8515438.1 hypothetical protein [Paenibacillus filicis]